MTISIVPRGGVETPAYRVGHSIAAYVPPNLHQDNFNLVEGPSAHSMPVVWVLSMTGTDDEMVLQAAFVWPDGKLLMNHAMFF